MSSDMNQSKETPNSGSVDEKDTQKENNKEIENNEISIETSKSNETKTISNEWDESSAIWIEYGDFTLTQGDKKVLESPKEWLDDTIMNAAQLLMKSQFPKIKGLQNVLLNSMKPSEFESVGAKDSFVQIVNDGGNHWVVLSNARVHQKANKCYIYDSKGQFDVDYYEDVTNAALKLMKTQPITLEVVAVSQQPDANQCGLYAVAFAYELCAGEDPSGIHFTLSGSHMRRHLLECLSKGEMTRFPTGNQAIVDNYII